MKQEFSKIIGIDSIKNNKIYFISKILFSIIFSLMITIDSMTTFSGKIWGTIEETYIADIKPYNILIFIAAFFITYIVIGLVEIIIEKLEPVYIYIYKTKKRRSKNIKVYFIFLIAILLCWSPILLSYFPGGVFIDLRSSVFQLLGKIEYTNHHPILYTYIIGLFMKIGGSIQARNGNIYGNSSFINGTFYFISLILAI